MNHLIENITFVWNSGLLNLISILNWSLLNSSFKSAVCLNNFKHRLISNNFNKNWIFGKKCQVGEIGMNGAGQLGYCILSYSYYWYYYGIIAELWAICFANLLYFLLRPTDNILIYSNESNPTRNRFAFSNKMAEFKYNFSSYSSRT